MSPPRVMEVNLADLDGDGYLDAVLANGPLDLFSAGEKIGQIWFIDGLGNFTADKQHFPMVNMTRLHWVI